MPALKDRVWSVTVGAAVGGLRKGLKVDGHRVAFHIEKTLKPEPNVCEVAIYNLSRTQRAQIEELRPKKGDKRGIPLLVEAGYKETGASQIWLGDLRTAWSEFLISSGDWVTHIETGDGEAAKKSSVAVAYGPGTTPDIALRAIVRALGVDEGNVAAAAIRLRQSGAATLLPKRAVFSGSASVNLTNFCRSAGLEWSIQDGAVQLLQSGKALDGKALYLTGGKVGHPGTPGTGLVESPSVDPLGVLTIKFLIQPGVKVGTLLVVDSETVQGNYKIEKAVWDGDTHAQPWYITAEAKRY
jgi:hypothetical protein